MNLLMRLGIVASFAAALGSAGAALAQDKMPAMHGMTMKPAPAAVGTSANETPADKAYAKANATMMNDMDAKPSGNADRDFVTIMLPHHQGALDMAKIELQYGKNPTLRAMASGIIKAQEVEIAEMKGWQAKHPR